MSIQEKIENLEAINGSQLTDWTCAQFDLDDKENALKFRVFGTYANEVCEIKIVDNLVTSIIDPSNIFDRILNYVKSGDFQFLKSERRSLEKEYPSFYTLIINIEWILFTIRDITKAKPLDRYEKISTLSDICLQNTYFSGLFCKFIEEPEVASWKEDSDVIVRRAYDIIKNSGGKIFISNGKIAKNEDNESYPSRYSVLCYLRLCEKIDPKYECIRFKFYRL
jgi:hypothetical protein